MSASVPSEGTGPFGAETAAAAQAKKALLFVAGSALQRYADEIRHEQEVLMHLSNMVMEVYAMDTAVYRLLKKNSGDIHGDLARTFINDAMNRVELSKHQIFAAVTEGDALRIQLGGLRRLLKWVPINTVKTRQRIAEHLVDHGRYAL